MSPLPDDGSARVAIVDLDGTLVDRDAGFARWSELFCARRRLDEEARAWVAGLDVARRRERRRFFVELVSGLGLDDDPDALWDDYRALMPRLSAPFPGVAEALEALRAAGWQLAVLSNGQPDNQRGKLEAAGLLGFFPVCRFSGATGLRKPDPAAFHDVLDAVGVPAGPDVWMVGDDPELDVVGSSDVGLSTMWIRHGRAWPADLPEPTAMATTPAAALQALAAGAARA